MAFFTTAVTGLKTVVTAIGAGVGVWGVINLLEGYSPVKVNKDSIWRAARNGCFYHAQNQMEVSEKWKQQNRTQNRSWKKMRY